MKTNIATVTFKGQLRYGEEQLFRGAFIKALGEHATILFHNHTEEGLRFSYPLVQYKIINGKPTILGFGDAIPVLTSINGERELAIGHQKRVFKVEEASIRPYTPQFDDTPKHYTLTRYIPLNKENLEEFDGLLALTDRICFVENIIVANILAFFKGIGYHCSDELHVAITSIDRKEKLIYKGVAFQGFDLSFVANAVLPDNIGLGKSSSVGYGVLHRIDEKEND